MNFVLDLVLLGICFLVIFFSAKRGFVRSIMGFASKIIALVVAYTFTPAVSEFIKTRFLMSPLSSSISSAIKSYVAVGEGYDFSSISERIPDVLERYLISGEDIAAKVDAAGKTGEEALRYVSEQIADKVCGMIATAIAFVGLFVVTCFALWLVTVIVDAIFKLPVLRTANTVLGVVFGVFSAALIALVYCAAVSMLVGALGAVAPKYFGADVLERTIIVKYLANKDILDITKNLIS